MEMSESKETPETTSVCLCGCEQEVNVKYQMGHDARHAGIVARQAVERAKAQGIDYLMDELYEALPTPALRLKSKRAAANIMSKAATRAERKASKRASFGAKDGDRAGIVRIGRWDYPARKNGRGEVVRNTKRDGSGTWAPANPELFKAL